MNETPAKNSPAPKLKAEQIRTYKRVTRIISVLFILFGIYVLAFLIPDVLDIASGPQEMTVSEAAERASDTRLYASLTDGDWICGSIVHVEGPSGSDFVTGRRIPRTRYTEVIVGDSQREIAVWTRLSGEVDCEELQVMQPTGYIYALNGNPSGRNTISRDLIRSADTVVELCGYCGLENSTIGLVFGAVSAILGIIGLIVASRIGRQQPG